MRRQIPLIYDSFFGSWHHVGDGKEHRVYWQAGRFYWADGNSRTPSPPHSYALETPLSRRLLQPKENF